MKRLLFALLAALTIPANAARSAEPDRSQWDAAAWRQAAYYDVLAAYRLFIDNHPGMYDLANPSFPATLARARAAGLIAAVRASDRDGYAAAMAAFNEPLADGHALIQVTRPQAAADAPRYWPGFVALWRGDRLLAVTVEAADPLYGAVIEACDGRPIDDFLRAYMIARGHRPGEKGQWWVRSSQAFYSIGEPAAEQPRSCTFRLADGTRSDRVLEWRQAETSEVETYRRLVFQDRDPIGLTEPRDGIFLISLPTFQPDPAGRERFAQLFSEVERRRAELLDARAVVIDLRGNGGGSSIWARDLARALWGREPFDSREPTGVAVYWRASPGNIAYLREFAAELGSAGEEEGARWVGRAAAEMDRARSRGEPLWREGGGDEPQPMAASPVESDFRTPVFVVNWGLCASACLDANDYFKRFTNSRLIGAPTSADSTYMEVRSAPLPHGPGQLIIPNKVWVGRPRGWGEVYEPDIAMTGLDWSTGAFLDRIEAELGQLPGSNSR